ncbi:MAG: hypothetical protein ACK5HY_16415 [Parahaliea sp.]
MYINRAVLLLLALAIIFMPAVEHWLWQVPEQLYRPYLLWLLAVLAGWWGQRSRYPDEL